MEPTRQRLARMSPAQRAAVAERADALHRVRIGHIAPRTDPGSAPASFAQERLWFVDALRPGSGAYNISLAIPFGEPLNVRALTDALSRVASRHETLRTTFALAGTSLRQIVHPATAISVPVLDLRRLGEPDRLTEIERITGRELDNGFDLSQGPVVRAVLIREAVERHTLLVTTHHICSDGWSVMVLRREIAAAYAACSRGAVPALPALPVQYSDYAAWQWERWGRGDWQPLMEHWIAEMRGAPARLTLPARRQRPAMPSLDGAWRGIHLPATVVKGLRRVGAAERCTPFMVLLAIYAATLQRFAGQDEVVVGVPVANRSRLELEGLIGFFVNAVPIRIRVSAADRFVDVLQRVRAAAVEAYQHQEFPFEKLVAALDLDPDVRYNPVFQATFSLQTGPLLQSSGPDAEHRADVIRGSIKFDLSLHLREAGETIVGSLGYSTELFEDELGRMVADSYVSAAATVAETPETRVLDLIPGASADIFVSSGLPPGADGALLMDAPHGIAVIDASGSTTWQDVWRDAEAQRTSTASEADPNDELTSFAQSLVNSVVAGLERHGAVPGTGGQTVPMLRKVFGALAEGMALTPGMLAVVDTLTPVHLRLVGLMAATYGLSLTTPQPSGSAEALLDHATWEGARAIFVERDMARALAEETFIPLHDLSLFVLGGPLSPSCAGALAGRGAKGVVLVDSDAAGPWILAASLEEAARTPVPVRPLADIDLAIRDADGLPVPQGAAGLLWGRRPGWSGQRIVSPHRVSASGVGSLELLIDDSPLSVARSSVPESPLTAALAGIWEDVLARPVGIDEDFFVIGGHSLAAAQVCARVEDLLRVRMPVQYLFAERTVRQLAARLSDEDVDGLERAAGTLLRVAGLSDAEAAAELAAAEAV